MNKKLFGIILGIILLCGVGVFANYSIIQDTPDLNGKEDCLNLAIGQEISNMAISPSDTVVVDDENIVSYKITPMSVAYASLSLKGLKEGNTTIHVYDGSVGYIRKNITVTRPIAMAKGSTVKFNTEFFSTIPSFACDFYPSEYVFEDVTYNNKNIIDDYTDNFELTPNNNINNFYLMLIMDSDQCNDFKYYPKTVEAVCNINVDPGSDILTGEDFKGVEDLNGNTLSNDATNIVVYQPDSFISNGKYSKTGIITAIVQDKTDSENIKNYYYCVYIYVAPTKITLNKHLTSKTIATVNKGKSLELTPSLTFPQGSDASSQYKDLIWSSSDEEILSFDENGKATAYKTGDVEITCTSAINPEATDTCHYYISTELTGQLNSEKTLRYLAPDDGTSNVTSWTNLASEDPSMIEVVNNTTVKGLKEGVTKLSFIPAGSTETKYMSFSVYKVNGPYKVNQELILSVEDLANLSNTYNDNIPTDKNIKSVYLGGTLTQDGKIKINTDKANDKMNVGFIMGNDNTESLAFGYIFKIVNPVESITVAPETLNLKVGDETTLTATVLPATADQTVTWTVGNPNVATVDQNGNVKVVGVGVTYIKATTNGTDEEGEQLFMDCILRVAKDNVESISLNKNELTLSLGADETLVPTILPESANYKKVGWTVGNPKVATVDKTGKVTAVGYGTTYVYCTTYATDALGNRLTDRCKVTVTSDPVESVTIPEEKELSLGDEYALTATVLPSTAIQDVTWTVGNKNVATVDKTGKVTAVGYGITYVTVITKGVDANGNRLKSRCKIVVSSDPAESITLSETEITLSVGDQETLTATVAPDTALQGVTWTVGNKNVATIDKTGKVTAVGAGSTYVTVFSKAKDANGNRLKTRCKVIVTSEPF